MNKTLRFLSPLALLAALLLAAPGAQAQVFITELADPDNNDGARYVELYNAGNSSVDLSSWTIQRYTNDNTSPSNPENLGTIPANGFYIVAVDPDEFEIVYGFAPDKDGLSNGASDSNGDDNIELLNADGERIDIFGVVGEDGTGTNHEFEDGRAERQAGVAQGNPTFDAEEWNVDNDSGGGDGPQNAPGDFDPGEWIGATPAGPTVQFASDGSFAGEASGSTTFDVTLDNPDGSGEVTVDVSFDASGSSATGGGADFSYAPQQVTFSNTGGGGAETETVTVTINDDTEQEGDEDAVFALENPSGSATVGSPSTHTLTIEDDETAPAPDLVINEILADPASGDDPNNDGNASTTQDEFVEIVNTSSSSVDISGYTIADEAQQRHIFPSGTEVPANTSITVFGGGSPTNIPGLTQTAGSLGLSNSGDTVTLADAAGTVVAQHTYGSEGGNDQSLARSPDFTGDFVLHESIGSNPASFSPGRDNTDNSPLEQQQGATVQFASASATAAEDAGAVALPVTIANAPADQQTTVDVVFDGPASDADASDFEDASAQTVTFAAGASDGTTQNATFTLADDTAQEGNEDAVFTLQNPSGSATVGSPSTYTLTIEDDEMAPTPDLVINEFMADPNGSTNTDLNDDGNADTGDEFVEILNATDGSIDLAGYEVVDTGGNAYVFPEVTLGAGQYAVIINDANGQVFGAFTDSGVPSLNDSGDDIRLLDSDGNVVTSVSYAATQAYEGISAARNPNSSGPFERQDSFGQMPSETAGQNNETGLGNDVETAVEISGDEGWRMLAPPFRNITAQNLADQNLVQSIDGGQYASSPPRPPNLYNGYDPGEGCMSDEAGEDDSDQADASNDFDCPDDMDETFLTGRGFIWYIYDDAPVAESPPLPFAWQPEGAVFPRDRSVSGLDSDQDFFLLGNPYNTNYDLTGLNLNKTGSDGAEDFSQVVQIWNPNFSGGTDANGNTGQYETVVRDDVAASNDGDQSDRIALGQGFFVERNSAQDDTPTQLTFSQSGRTGNPATFYGGDGASMGSNAVAARASGVASAPPRVLALRVEGQGAGASSTLYFAEGATRGADAYEASALVPLATPYATVAFERAAAPGDTAATLLEQASLPHTLDEAATLPVRVRTYGEVGSQLTLSWPRMDNIPGDWTLTLEDRQTGATVDLRETEAYTFTRPAASSLAAASKSQTRSGQAPPATPKAVRLKAPTRPAGTALPADASPRFTLTVAPGGTIPVESAGFAARADGRAALLSWRTYSEQRNDRFVVERRSESSDWVEAATVETQAPDGTSSERLDYRARIEDLSYGAHTFRLRQYDRGDGEGTLVGEAQRVEIQMSEAYVLSPVYPNPMRSSATVEVAVRETESVTVSLYDAQGRKVKVLHDGPLGGGETMRFKLEATGLASGLYIVRLRGGHGTRSRTVTLVR